MANAPEDSIAENRSMLKDLVGSVASMTGDLSNMTAPPFVLDKVSAVQIPAFTADNTTVFCAPARSDDPAERALLALKSFLTSIRGQCYTGRTQEQGPKKPLNAFLGELYIVKYKDGNGVTQYVSEQVSHHPPITACRVWNEEHGILDESFNRTSMTFSGSVNVHSVGLVIKTLKKYDEHYLFPIPDFKIKGLLSKPAPDLTGKYYIPSTSGFMSVINFSEKGFFGSASDKHNFEAHVYKEDDGEQKPRYTLKGSWYGNFVIEDVVNQKKIETVNIEKDVMDQASERITEPLEEQDPWESNKAWKEVQAALDRGDMSAVTKSKDNLEDGQRQMRDDEKREKRTWEPLFFKPASSNEILKQLIAKLPTDDDRRSVMESETIWTFDEEKWANTKKPYHSPLRPDNTRAGEQSQTVNEGHTERRSEGQPTEQFDDGIDHKIGAVEDGRPAEADGVQIDIGQSPEKKHIEGITMKEPGPQAAQTGTKEEYIGSGIEDMTLKEKHAIEDMLRNENSTGNDERDYIQRKKKAAATQNDGE